MPKTITLDIRSPGLHHDFSTTIERRGEILVIKQRNASRPLTDDILVVPLRDLDRFLAAVDLLGTNGEA